MFSSVWTGRFLEAQTTRIEIVAGGMPLFDQTRGLGLGAYFSETFFNSLPFPPTTRT